MEDKQKTDTEQLGSIIKELVIIMKDNGKIDCLLDNSLAKQNILMLLRQHFFLRTKFIFLRIQQASEIMKVHCINCWLQNKRDNKRISRKVCFHSIMLNTHVCFSEAPKTQGKICCIMAFFSLKSGSKKMLL